LPFEKDTFDAVVCVDALEHVADLNKVIFEIARVTKTDGIFFFDTITKTDESKFVMITMFEDTLNVIPKGSHDWNKFVEPDLLKSLLINTGFNKIEFKGFEVKGKDEKTGASIVEIHDTISVMYIGKAVLFSKD